MDWNEIERRRKTAGLSRAEMCRRAGISESTATKGLRYGTRPSAVVARAVTQVIEQAEQAA